MTSDLFSEINNALLDLQASQLQTFERPLKKLAKLLNHSDLDSYNKQLKNGLDVDEFLTESENSGGSMVGSHQLVWPEDSEKILGLTLLLIDKFAADPRFSLNFSYQYFYTSKKAISNIHSLTGQLLIPFVRDYKNYILSEEACSLN